MTENKDNWIHMNFKNYFEEIPYQRKKSIEYFGHFISIYWLFVGIGWLYTADITNIVSCLSSKVKRKFL